MTCLSVLYRDRAVRSLLVISLLLGYFRRRQAYAMRPSATSIPPTPALTPAAITTALRDDFGAAAVATGGAEVIVCVMVEV